MRFPLHWLPFALLSSVAAASARTPPLAFTHVTVIDATGTAAKQEQTVLVADGRIVAVGPSTTTEVLRRDPPQWIRYVPPALQDEWNPERDWRLNQRDASEIEHSHLLFDQDLKLVRALHAAGVPIMAGTDSTEPYTYPGFSLHEELEWLAKAGLSPMEAIQSATRTPAEFLGRLDRAGRYFDRATLDVMLARVAGSAAQIVDRAQ